MEDSLNEGIKVLDCACGPASWTMEMAKDYPRSEFEGLDVTTSFPNAIKPENCHFTVHNMIDPFPFPENHFEYIHQRLLVLGLLASEWDSVRIRSITMYAYTVLIWSIVYTKTYNHSQAWWMDREHRGKMIMCHCVSLPYMH